MGDRFLLMTGDPALRERLVAEISARGGAVDAVTEVAEVLAGDVHAYQAVIYDLGLQLPDAAQQFTHFRVTHPLMPVVFLLHGDEQPDFEHLKGPFALVHRIDLGGQFLDKLLDILGFFAKHKSGKPRARAGVADSDLAQFDARLASLLSAIHKMASPEVDAFESVLRELANLTHAQGGSLFAFERNMLVLKHAIDPGHVPDTIQLPLKPQSPFDQVIHEPKPLLIKDIRGSQGLAHSGWKGYNDGSLMVLPLMDASLNIVALISLHNKAIPPFNERDLALARQFASIASHLIFDHDTVRDLAAESPIGLALFDGHGAIHEVNQAFCRIVGRTRDACLNQNYWDMTASNYHGPEKTLLQELGSSNRPTAFEKAFVRPDGDQVRVRLRFSRFRSGDEPWYLASVETR